ncbi:hypothetical protein HPB48_006926 [Haemaphysalis longicornis]|uniref:Alpha 1,4-glycosyltransferase domain-containing protein n=1 Tax=Haemaphysalis longicornis TaxID=44386 RepID=A0A9J6FA10_HAELO|nr:hypothetical protein HPB48_006926 [Haemaphysalis longicornis]
MLQEILSAETPKLPCYRRHAKAAKIPRVSSERKRGGRRPVGGVCTFVRKGVAFVERELATGGWTDNCAVEVITVKKARESTLVVNVVQQPDAHEAKVPHAHTESTAASQHFSGMSLAKGSVRVGFNPESIVAFPRADLDVVVRRPMAKLRNSVGKEDNSSATLNTAVMVLRKRHPVLKLMMEDMARMYSPVSWSHASASSLLRVLHEHYRCVNGESAEFAPSEERRCVPHSAEAKGNWNQGASDEDAVTLHPFEAFNPVHFSERNHYWYRNFANQTLRAVNSSYVLHLWAAERTSFTGPPEEGSAYAHEARINCPRVYGVYGG